jgi:hypothetical protein
MNWDTKSLPFLLVVISEELSVQKAGTSFRSCGEGGIRTLDTSLSSYNGLANRPFRPLRHLSKKSSGLISEGEAKININSVAPKLGLNFLGEGVRA